MPIQVCEITEQGGLTHPGALQIIRRVAATGKTGTFTYSESATGEGGQLGFDPEKQGRRYRLMSTVAGIPATLVAGALVGYFLGRWFDQRLDTAPWMQLVFIFLGMAAAIRNIKHLLKRVEKESEDL